MLSLVRDVKVRRSTGNSNVILNCNCSIIPRAPHSVMVRVVDGAETQWQIKGFLNVVAQVGTKDEMCGGSWEL